ncbi:hypothetical protein [Methylocella tundrae]|nr:hypothetical protein [Methylocella tundrae]
MDRRTFFLSTLGFAAGVAAIGMTTKAAEAMMLVIPKSPPLLSPSEGIEQAQYWGGNNEDWRYRQRWRGGDEDENEDDDDDDEG